MVWTIPEYDIFEVSSSLIRLSNFGLIELMYDRTAGKDIYDKLQVDSNLQAIFLRYQKANPNV